MHLIVGGTGALGRAVTRRLLDDNRRVRVMTRGGEQAAARIDRRAEIVAGDLLDRDSLASACRGADVVVAAAHSMLGRGGTASVHVDGQGHRDLVDAARAAGARRFVYISVYDHGPAFRAVPFFRIKLEVEDYLRASGLAGTIVRPTAFMETHAHKLIGEPILRGGRTIVFGRGEQPRNFVAADDVARLVVLAIDDASLIGDTVDVGGPENPTTMDVVRLYERVSGRRARVIHVPIGLLRVGARLVRPIHPGIGQVVQSAILGETVPQQFDAAPLEQRFGVRPTRLAAWVAERVARELRRPAAPYYHTPPADGRPHEEHG